MNPTEPPTNYYQAVPPPPPPAMELLPEVDIANPGPQPRLTVFFRLILLIPHFIILWALGIGSALIAIVSWFAALFTAKTPEFAYNYQTAYLNWQVRVDAYLFFLSSQYPPFSWEPTGPVIAYIPPPVTMNRAAVFFRIILVIPAAILNALVSVGLAIASIVEWVIVLIQGRTPDAVFAANAAAVRFRFRLGAYWLLVTSAYPKKLFGDGEVLTAPPASPTRPLIVTGAAKVLVIVYIVLGVIGYATQTTVQVSNDSNSSTSDTYDY
ncbi:DUF4389 domain-containing protein [Jongsikchunia kroppenstedtii]|uniref:DUF4389 domain-containing protein n=1 Tax=Jongsikchunia kroppenstedtii TaxID=1121721 RepID=UPI00036AC340|nr:DUF4389 domain-containing protein [Jongsikchunia kroppenstedtii]